MNTGTRGEAEGQRFLNLSRLKPYDVILWKSSGIVADAIAKGTSGRFSHALMVVSTCFFFDARKEGQNFRCFDVKYLHRNKAGELDVYADVSDYEDLIVLRHPLSLDLHPATCQMLQEQLLDVLSYIVLDHYARISKFLPFLKLHQRVSTVLRNVLDRLSGDGELPNEKFCSQLVLELLRTCGFDLYSDSRPSGCISPNDLANSCLVKVGDCVVDAQLPRDEISVDSFAIVSFASIMSELFSLTGRYYKTILDWEHKNQSQEHRAVRKQTLFPAIAMQKFVSLEKIILQNLPIPRSQCFYSAELSSELGTYSGDHFLSLPHGRGVATFAPDSIARRKGAVRYEGEWFAGYLHGNGTMEFVDGESWTGRWILSLQQEGNWPPDDPLAESIHS